MTSWSRVCRFCLSLGLLAALGPSAPVVAQHGSVLVEKAPAQEASADEIRQDIAALAQHHGAGKNAAERLAFRGDLVLPQLHAVLKTPDATARQKIQVVSVIAEIGAPTSIGALIELAQDNPDHGGIRQAVLDALSELPLDPAGSAFADAILADREESWRVRRKALVYFGRHRVATASRWVDAYVADPQIELRAGALYLSARLGAEAALNPMVEMLALPAPKSLRYALMLGIAELTTNTEFPKHTPEWIRSSWEYASALRYAEFRSASVERRSEMTMDMLGSEALFERQEAARHILETRGADSLAELAGQDVPPYVRAVARRQLRTAGYRVQLDERGKAHVERKVQP